MLHSSEYDHVHNSTEMTSIISSDCAEDSTDDDDVETPLANSLGWQEIAARYGAREY